MRQFLQDIITEATAVARAKGINLSENYVTERLEFIDGLPYDMTSSTHHDLNRGNPLEVAWLSGAISRFGDQLGIDTPVNRTVDAALRPYAKQEG
jgi:2-dehydropantoate 2-reductase